MSILLAAFASLYILWLFYLAVMNLKQVKDANKLSKAAYYFGLPILYTGLLLDCLVNVFVLTIILLEIPKEWLVTARLIRHSHGTGWRKTFAVWIGENLLDAFDPSGRHIK